MPLACPHAHGCIPLFTYFCAESAEDDDFEFELGDLPAGSGSDSEDPSGAGAAEPPSPAVGELPDGEGGEADGGAAEAAPEEEAPKKKRQKKRKKVGASVASPPTCTRCRRRNWRQQAAALRPARQAPALICVLAMSVARHLTSLPCTHPLQGPKASALEFEASRALAAEIASSPTADQSDWLWHSYQQHSGASSLERDGLAGALALDAHSCKAGMPGTPAPPYPALRAS